MPVWAGESLDLVRTWLSDRNRPLQRTWLAAWEIGVTDQFHD